MKTKFAFTADVAALFSITSGLNFRVQAEDGVVRIKASTRPYPVLSEFGFGRTEVSEDGARSAVIEGELPVGTFSLQAGKYGWATLVADPVGGLTLSHVAE
jgi:hypothetical protein